MNKTDFCLNSGLRMVADGLSKVSANLMVAALTMGVLLLAGGFPARSDAALIRPLEGSGNFHSVIDVHNRWNDDGTINVILLVAVANRELTFIAEDGFLQARIRAEAEIAGPDGHTWYGRRDLKARTTSRAELSSGSMYQIFTVVIRGVPLQSGRLVCRIFDGHRVRSNILSQMQDEKARSIAVTDWFVEPDRRLRNGLVLSDPIFLNGAPLALWGTSESLAREVERSEIFSSLHPTRRYGLEQDRLQVFFEIEPPTAGAGDMEGAEGIAMQILAKDLDFALRDTLVVDEERLRVLAAGRPVGMFFEVDVNALPPGPYQLTCWPVGESGRGWLAEFDVVWSMESLNRHCDELLGEGRTVLMGKALRDFLDAGLAEREAILAAFWADHDSDPETSVNEAYLEFRERISYVRSFLGGFNSLGAVDPRGRVYLLLGEPNRIDAEAMPANSAEFEDALVRVHDQFQPRRPGPWAKGPGGIPIETSYVSRREIEAHRNSNLRDKAFELWIYDLRARQLFKNMYSNRNLGLTFLFVDRTGVGHYHLEATNNIEDR